MASSIYKRGPTTPEMNITPLIDVVFLLIIFFMLVNNLLGEQSARMIVPRLTDANTHRLSETDHVVVNVLPQPYNPTRRRDSPLYIPGQPAGVKVGLETFGMDELAQVTARLRRAKLKNAEVQVLLRADGGLYYQAVRRVMAAITAAGIRKVDVVAYMPRRRAAAGR